MLLNDYGFAESQITILTKREETTHEAIKKALERLLADTHEGDVVYFHYSDMANRSPTRSMKRSMGTISRWYRLTISLGLTGLKNVRNKEIRDWLSS